MANRKENLKEVSGEELSKKLSALRENLRTLRFKSEGAKSKNVKEELALRRAVARILTEVNFRNKT
jgi:ribosomal protein L29